MIIASDEKFLATSDCWEEEQIFESGELYFDEIERRIESAQRCIDVEMYIFRFDSLGNRLLTALGQAAGRGVRVRLLVDGVGSFGYIRALATHCQSVGIEFAAYRALPFRWRKESSSWSDWITNFFAFIDRVNARNHVKLWLFDAQEAWTGSYNVSHVHLSAESRQAWKDIGVRVRGPAIAELVESFENQWITRGWFERREGSSLFSPLVVISVSRRAGRALYRRLLQKLRRSNERIWIVTAYFVPNGSLLRALKSAARRGVDVRILVPRSSDVLFLPFVTSAYYMGLLRAGASIYEYLPTVLHAKTIIVDQEMFVGTSNINHRSLLHDRELDVAITTPAARIQLEGWFQEISQNSREITLSQWVANGFWRRVIGELFLSVRYWL